jgi:hypothetical protein
MLDKIKNEGNWISISVKINLNVFHTRFKNKPNGLYRQLSSGNQKLLGISNFKWFYHTFDKGFYRFEFTGTRVQYFFFLRLMDQNQVNTITRQLIIRCKKLGASKVEVGGMNSINYIDFKLLSSSNGINAYKKILKTYQINN